EWPAFAAAPGVWYRLVTQAAQALAAAHGAGLVHGHLDASSFVLTGDGLLKLCGLGEPGWLAENPPPDDINVSAAGDLPALGRVGLTRWAQTQEGGATTVAPLAPSKGRRYFFSRLYSMTRQPEPFLAESSLGRSFPSGMQIVSASPSIS